MGLHYVYPDSDTGATISSDAAAFSDFFFCNTRNNQRFLYCLVSFQTLNVYDLSTQTQGNYKTITGPSGSTTPYNFFGITYHKRHAYIMARDVNFGHYLLKIDPIDGSYVKHYFFSSGGPYRYITFLRNQLFYIEGSGPDIGTMDVYGNIKKSVTTSLDTYRGIANDGHDIYLIDRTTDRIEKRSGSDLSLIKNISNPFATSFTYGLAWDRRKLICQTAADEEIPPAQPIG